jgi:hypothetical protein
MVQICLLMTVAVCLCHLTWTSHAFSTKAAGTVYPPLSRDEVQSLLDNVPVYAVTDPAQQAGLVLLQPKNNPNQEQQANFFFSPENANAKYAPFREKNSPTASQWEITQYPLGLVWFELLSAQEESKGIDYRLIPNPLELASARSLVQQSPEIPNNLFQANYNEIPVFWDPQLRVQVHEEENNEPQFPLYFGYQDMLHAVKNASSASSSSSYQPAISVTDLKTLMDEMIQLESTIDFRNAIFVPPSSPNPLERGEGAWQEQ